MKGKPCYSTGHGHATEQAMEDHHTRSYGGVATEHATPNRSCWRGPTDMRVANDGVSYSYDDFVQDYGINLGARTWNIAAPCTESRIFSNAPEHATANARCWRAAAEMRVANDGISYSYYDFV